MKYTIGSGYYAGSAKIDGFSGEWIYRISKSNPPPQAVVVLGVGGSQNPYGDKVQYVSLGGNLGHIGSVISGSKPYSFCGWSAGAMSLAMIAYNNETDFIYVEQDCLVFGDWVSGLYSALGSSLGIVFGSNRLMECAQSLFLVRHSFIPEFVKDYISLGSDGRIDNIPENKFARLEREKPGLWGRFSFGYDRDRPINTSDPAFYAQQITQEELSWLTGLP